MRALLIVDMQNDFMPSGALPVPNADKLVPLINDLMHQCDLIVATLDWHPPHHKSFASAHSKKKPGERIDFEGYQQLLWPDHCIAHSSGAELVSELNTNLIDHLVYKGDDLNIDSYSAFFDNAKQKSTGLEQLLKKHNVSELYICGVALDYCVRHSAIDAANLGYKVFLVIDACKGAVISPGDIEKAITEMLDAGVKFITTKQILSKKN
jgi:nicotinamidase/pyrazinamidase